MTNNNEPIYSAKVIQKAADPLAEYNLTINETIDAMKYNCNLSYKKVAIY